MLGLGVGVWGVGVRRLTASALIITSIQVPHVAGVAAALPGSIGACAALKNLDLVGTGIKGKCDA